jgi:hypothetical protein
VQFADAIETGVARAAAMASSMSADALSSRLAERKRAAAGSQGPLLGLPAAAPGSPRPPIDADGAMTPGRGPISARFPAFAQRSRGSPSASRHTSQAEEVHVPAQGTETLPVTDMQGTKSADGCASLAPLRQATAAADSQHPDAADTSVQPPPVQAVSSAADKRGNSAEVEEEAESGSSRGSLDAALQSPTKKARPAGLPPFAQPPMHDSLTAGLDIAILSAMAVPRATTAHPQESKPGQHPQSFHSGAADGTKPAAKVSPRGRNRAGNRNRSRRAQTGVRGEASTVKEIMEPLSGATSSCGSGQLALAGLEFESALFDSDASRQASPSRTTCASILYCMPYCSRRLTRMSCNLPAVPICIWTTCP